MRLILLYTFAIIYYLTVFVDSGRISQDFIPQFEQFNEGHHQEKRKVQVQKHSKFVDVFSKSMPRETRRKLARTIQRLVAARDLGIDMSINEQSFFSKIGHKVRYLFHHSGPKQSIARDQNTKPRVRHQHKQVHKFYHKT